MDGWSPSYIRQEIDLTRCSLQGTLLEKYFTMEPEEFARYLRAHDHPQAESDNLREAYRYSKVPQITYTYKGC